MLFCVLCFFLQMVEVSANHSILCNEKLYIPHIDKNKPVTWTFKVASSVSCFLSSVSRKSLNGDKDSKREGRC